MPILQVAKSIRLGILRGASRLDLIDLFSAPAQLQQTTFYVDPELIRSLLAEDALIRSCLDAENPAEILVAVEYANQIDTIRKREIEQPKAGNRTAVFFRNHRPPELGAYFANHADH